MKILMIMSAACVFGIFAISGCGGGSSAQQSPVPNSQSPLPNPNADVSTTAQSPYQELVNLTKAENISFSVELTVINRESDYATIDKWTQKNGNFRLDQKLNDKHDFYSTDYRCTAGPTYEIYSASKKQGTKVRCFNCYEGLVNGHFEPCQTYEYGTSGWTRADIKIEETYQNILLEVVANWGGGAWSKANSSMFKELQKEGDKFSWKKDDDTDYVLETDGPEGLPSRLITRRQAYGANKEETKDVLEFKYTDVNQIPDSMFELPSDLPVVDTGNISDFSLSAPFGMQGRF